MCRILFLALLIAGCTPSPITAPPPPLNQGNSETRNRVTPEIGQAYLLGSILCSPQVITYGSETTVQVNGETKVLASASCSVSFLINQSGSIAPAAASVSFGEECSAYSSLQTAPETSVDGSSQVNIKLTVTPEEYKSVPEVCPVFVGVSDENGQTLDRGHGRLLLIKSARESRLSLKVPNVSTTARPDGGVSKIAPIQVVRADGELTSAEMTGYTCTPEVTCNQLGLSVQDGDLYLDQTVAANELGDANFIDASIQIVATESLSEKVLVSPQASIRIMNPSLRPTITRHGDRLMCSLGGCESESSPRSFSFEAGYGDFETVSSGSPVHVLSDGDSRPFRCSITVNRSAVGLGSAMTLVSDTFSPPEAFGAKVDLSSYLDDRSATCVGSTVDLDGDSLTYRYSWTVNGSRLPEASGGLSRTIFNPPPSSLVSCQIEADDGKGGITVADSAAVTVNSPPELNGVILTDTSRLLQPSIDGEPHQYTTCDVDVLDIDGDPIQVDVFWTIDGTEYEHDSAFAPVQQFGSDLGSHRYSVYFDRKAEIGCRAVVTDSLGQSVEGTSDTRLFNRPPSLFAANLSYHTGYGGQGAWFIYSGLNMYVTAFTCSGSTADPDLGDTITYHYRWATEAPDGSTSVIENATANRAVIYPNQSVRCQVIATDAHGYETASLWSVPMTGHDSSNWYDPYGNAVYSANLYAANVSVDGPSFSANAPTFAEQLQAGSHDSGSTPNPIPPAYLSALGLDRDMDSYRYRCGGGEGIASYQLDGVEVQSLATSEDLVVPRSSLLAGSFLGHSVDGANLTCTISSLEGEPVASASGHVRMLSVQIQPATSVFTADDVDFSKPLAASGVIGCVVDGEVVSPSTKQQSSDLYDQSLCQLSTWSSSGSLWPATEDPICSWPPQEEVFFITATGVNKTGVGISRLQCQISRSGGEVSSIACAPTTSSQNLADESGPFFESGTSSNTVSNPVTKIVSTARGFAAIHQDGSVSTWGQHRPGDGISYDLASSVRTRLDAKPVSDIVASSWHHNRFVAIHTDGTLTTWGEEYSQRDMATQFSEVEGDMVNVREVVANRSGAFAVIHQDDSVTTFGAGRYGGVAPPLEDVQQVVANDLAFAALHEDGSVTAWGSLDAGGGVTLPPGAVDIVATRYAFAALYSDGSVKAFGAPSFGGSISHIESELSGAVEAIFSSDRSFVAVYEDGTAIRWGHYSGYSPTSGQMSFLQAQAPSEIVSISSLYPENREGYWSQLVALRADGLVDPVGSAFYHAADDDYPEALKSPISALASDSRSHLAIHQSGDVTVWGSSVTDHLQDGGQVITRLSSRPAPVSALSSYRGFAIIHEDGSVTSWRGRVLTNYTWSTSGFLHSVEDRLNGASPVTEIVTTLYSFAAIHEDGSVTTWGLSSSGGDSRGVSGLR